MSNDYYLDNTIALPGHNKYWITLQWPQFESESSYSCNYNEKEEIYIYSIKMKNVGRESRLEKIKTIFYGNLNHNPTSPGEHLQYSTATYEKQN